MLGPLEVWHGERRMELGPPLQRALLALLVLRAGQIVAADTIVELLWEGRAPSKALSSVYAYVSGLRRALEPDRGGGEPWQVLTSGSSGYVLHVAPEQVDAERFTTLLVNSAQEPGRLDRLDEALGLWRGAPYADIAGMSWVEPEAARLEELHRVAVEQYSEVLLEMGHAGQAAAGLVVHLRDNPLRERAAALLARALYVDGRQSEALAVLRGLRGRLVEDLGLEPDPSVAELEAAILRHEPHLATVPSARAHLQGGSSSPAAAARPFVGRRAALAQLVAALTLARQANAPHVILVDGEPGIGKSRLVEQALEGLAGDTRVGWGASPEQEVAAPLWPWLQALRQLGVSDSQLTELIDVPAPHAPGSRLQMFDGLTRRLAEMAPLVLVLDDLQWADNASLALLEHLAAERQVGAVTVVVTLRRHEAATVTHTLAALARSGTTRISLDGLAVEEVAALAATVLDSPLDMQRAKDLARRSTGNPFYVLELARLNGAGISAPVRDVVQARLNRLAPPVADLLKVAAVGGLEVHAQVCAPAAGLDIDAVLDFLDAAVAAGLLVETDRAGRYRFAHALTREAIAGSLPRSRRARLHRRLGEVTAELWAHVDDRAAEIARHWLEAAALDAGTARTAAAHAAQAARVAERRLAAEDAALWWQEALAASELGDADPSQRFDLLVGLASAHEVAGQWQDMLAAIEQAITIAGDISRVAQAANAAVGRSLWYPWQYGSVPARLMEAVAQALTAGGEEPSPERAVLLGVHGVANAHVGDRVTANAASAAALAVAEALPDQALLGRILHLRLLSLQGPLQVSEQLAVSERLRLLDGASDEQLIAATLSQVSLLLTVGEFAAADRRLRAAEADVDALRSPALWLQTALTRVALLTWQGDYLEAEALAERVRRLGERVNVWGVEPSLLVGKAAYAFERGQMPALCGQLRATLEAGVVPVTPMLALALRAGGDEVEARALLASMPEPSPDYSWLGWAATALVAAVELRQPELVRRQCELLDGHRDHFVVMGTTAGIFGCVQQLLGEAALYLGQTVRARRELQDACQRLESTGSGYWGQRARQALAKVD